jgi:Flp pilus assembly protein TadD
MGMAYFFTHRLEKAGLWFALATRLDPRNPTAWMNLADLDVSAGRPDSARVRYVTALQLLDEQIHANPGNIKLRVQRGLCTAKLGRCADARTTLASVSDSLLADNAELTHQLAKAYALCDRREDALAAVRRAVALGISPSVLRGDPELQALVRDPGFPAAPAHKMP